MWFIRVQKVRLNMFAEAAVPWTLLRELTVLPKSLSWIKGDSL